MYYDDKTDVYNEAISILIKTGNYGINRTIWDWYNQKCIVQMNCVINSRNRLLQETFKINPDYKELHDNGTIKLQEIYQENLAIAHLKLIAKRLQYKINS